MCKSKQFAPAEYMPPDNEVIATAKNNVENSTIDVFVCETCGLQYAHKNDLSTHLKIHHGN